MANKVPTLEKNTYGNIKGVAENGDSFIVVGNQRINKASIQRAKQAGMTDKQINDIINKSNEDDMHKDMVKYTKAVRTKSSDANKVKSDISKKYRIDEATFDKKYNQNYVSSKNKEVEVQHLKDNDLEDYYNSYRNAQGGSNVVLSDLGKKKNELLKAYNMDEKEFDEIFKEFKAGKDAQYNKKMARGMKEYSEAHPFLGSVGSVGLNLITPLEGAKNLAKGAVGKLNPETDYLYSDMVRSAREGAKENFGEVGDTIYDLGMGGTDMLAQLGVGALTGGGSTLMGAMQGLNTSNDMQRESLENGNSQRQAALTGALGGAVGFGLAKYGADELIKYNPSGVLSSIGKGVLTEGLEEGAESIADKGIDSGISKLMGGTSSSQALKNQLIEQGYSEEDADKLVKKSNINDVLMSAGSGALMGGVFGGASGLKTALDPRGNFALNNAMNGVTLQDARNYQPTKVEALETTANPVSKPNNNVDVLNPQTVNGTPTTTNTNESVNALTPEEIDALYDSVERDNLGTGLSRKDTQHDIFKTGKKGINKGQLQIAQEIVRANMDNDTFANTKTLRTDFNKAVREFAEQGTQSSYDNMMNLANQIAEMLPEENPINPEATRGEFLAQIGFIADTPEIRMNMDVENALDIIYDRNTPIEDKINAWHEVTNKYNNDNARAKYGNVFNKAAEFLSKISRRNKNTSNNTQTTNQNITTPDMQEGSGNERVRGNYASQPIPDSVLNEIDKLTYNQLTNKETSAKADKVFRESTSLNDAYAKFKEMLDRYEAASVPLGYRLASEYIDAGEHAMAVEITESIAKQMTKAGQFTQSAYITAMKSNPFTVMTAINKELGKINEKARSIDKNWVDVQLTDAEVEAFNNIQQGDTDALTSLTDSIYKRIAKDYPHTKWEKFYDLTKTFMLLNPRTHLRNVIANAVTKPVRSLTDRVKTAMEVGYQLVDKDYKRTSSVKGGDKQQKAEASKIFDIAFGNEDNKWLESGQGKVESKSQLWKDNPRNGEAIKNRAQKSANFWLNVLDWANNLTDGRFNDSTGIVDAFRNYAENDITGSHLENMRQFDYLLLGDIEDTPFVKQNFVNALANYMAAQNIRSADQVPPEAIALAKDEALKATFKDDNFLTQALASLKKSPLNKLHLIDVLMPFTKTPANLAMRGIEYSPVGFAKSIKEFNGVKSKGDITNADISKFIGELSKNVTGTTLIALGYALAKGGVITGTYDDNKNARNFEKAQGFQEYAFHVGNTYYTYDWSQPTSIPLIIGTAIYEGMEESAEDDSKAVEMVKSLGKGMVNASDAWFDLSPLKNLSDVLGGGDNATYSGNSITTNIGNVMAEYPQTLIPSVLGATARTVDPTMRNTFDKTSALKTYGNKALAKIPGASMLLPASYDAWGAERRRNDSVGGAAFSQYVNPGTLGYHNEGNADIDNYIQSLYDATGKDTVFPRSADYTVGEDKRELNNREYSERQKAQGKTQADFIREFSKIADKSGLTKEEQADIVSNIYSGAKAKTDHDMYGGNYSNKSKSEIKALNKGAEAYARYTVDKAIAIKNDLDYDKYMDLMKEGGTNRVNSYTEHRTNAKEISNKYGIDFDVDSYEKYVDKGASNKDIDFIGKMNADLKKSLEPGKSATTSQKIEYIGNYYNSEEERSRMLSYILPKDSYDSKYVQAGIDTFGNSALYSIFSNHYAADLDGNGSLTKKEVEQFTSQFSDVTLKKNWNYVLYGASHPKKKK